MAVLVLFAPAGVPLPQTSSFFRVHETRRSVRYPNLDFSVMPSITGADTSAGGILACGAICALRRRKYICDAGVQQSIVAPTASVGSHETDLKADSNAEGPSVTPVSAPMPQSSNAPAIGTASVGFTASGASVVPHTRIYGPVAVQPDGGIGVCVLLLP